MVRNVGCWLRYVEPPEGDVFVMNMINCGGGGECGWDG